MTTPSSGMIIMISGMIINTLNATGLIDETTEAALKRVLDFIQGSRWKASQHAHIEMTHPSPQRDNIIDDEPVDD